MLSRRGFIVSGIAAGGGLALALGIRALDDGDARDKFARAGRPGAPFNAWLKITPEGEIICAVHRAELGQGVTTMLPMLLAEELDADWERVRFEFAPQDRDYYNFGMMLRGQPLGDPEASLLAGTGTWAIRQVFHAMGMAMTISSSSTVDAWDTLRPAGAAARGMLLTAAAERWEVPLETLRTESGRVYDDRNERSLGYGELAEAAARIAPPADAPLKPASEYKLVGRNPPRLDTLEKVTGRARYGIDVRRPGMLYAAVVHSPVAGTRVARFDAGRAERMPGVRQVLLAGEAGQERAVAVVADSTWQAQQAAATVEVESAVEGPLMETAELQSRYTGLLDETPVADADDGPVLFVDDAPSPDDAPAAPDASTFTADYAVPFLAHACMEPMNCTALFTGDRLEIWSPSQANSFARDIAAQMSGLPAEKVAVHATFMGGGFGRRAEMDFVQQAVSVALALRGTPVQVTWSREQDIRHDAFRPAAHGRLSASLDADGVPTAMELRLATQSVVADYEKRTPTPRGGTARSDSSVITAFNPPWYPVDALRVSFNPVDTHVPAGYWRSVSHSWCAFFLENFVDELAVRANADGYEYRAALLADRPRHLRVLRAAAERAGWDRPAPANGGRGIALAESHGTVVAHVIDVTTANGEFERVARVVTAIDCGIVVHPDNVVAQMESSVVDGLSSALYGAVDFVGGVAQQGNFDTYRRLRMHETPLIEVHLLESTERPGGVGEPGVPGVAPALVNAIFAATGERLRSLPILSRKAAARSARPPRRATGTLASVAVALALFFAGFAADTGSAEAATATESAQETRVTGNTGATIVRREAGALQQCVSAAEAFLAALDSTQTARAAWPFEGDKRRKWTYFPNVPQLDVRKEGLAFGDMAEPQRLLAHRLVECGLSTQGYQKTAGLMRLDDILGQTELFRPKKPGDEAPVGADKYFLAVFGEPSVTEPWGWQLEGHHLALNFTAVDGRIAFAPAFMGADPVVVQDGRYAGWRMLGGEIDKGVAVIEALDDAQRERAIVAEEIPQRVLAGPGRADALEAFQGLPASALDDRQRGLLWVLIEEYLANGHQEIAAEHRAEIERHFPADTWFAWMGPTDPAAGIYYRVHSPALLIEFVTARDRQTRALTPNPNHVHTLFRHPGNDFGDDYLGDHYANDPAHRSD